jgi:tetratricopeptide (TPR) repeat protein
MQLIEGKSLAALIEELRGRPASSGGGGTESDQSDSFQRLQRAPNSIEPIVTSVPDCAAAADPGTMTPTTADFADLHTQLSQSDCSRFRAIAEMIAQAADALEHAHSLGIVHRDVKPGNLLLDQSGHLWVTDFGLARFGNDAGLTMTGDLVGTLRYMSPEQALAKHGLVDIRTDVYSLGASLYEFLTLRPAVDGVDKEEVLNSIVFSDPVPPRKRDRSIPTELGTVALKALSKNPNERYLTAGGLADDLRAWLDDRPIRAKRPTIAQRVRKWSRRHQPVVWAAATIALVALAASAVLLWREKHWTQEAYETLAAEQKKTQAALQAELKRRKQTRDALDALSSQVVQDWMAKQTKLSPDQMRLLEQSLKDYEELASDTGQDEESRFGVADAHRRVGAIRSLFRDTKGAQAAWERSRELYAALAADFPLVPGYRQGLALSQRNLGYLFHDTGRVRQAEEAYGQALAIEEQLAADFPAVPEYRRDLAASLRNLGRLLDAADRGNQAEEAFLRAVAIQTRLAADFPAVPAYRHELATTLSNLGALLNTLGRNREAEQAYGRALAIQARLAADFPSAAENRDSLASSHMRLAQLLKEMGQTKEAEGALVQAVGIRKQLAADYPTVPGYRQFLAISHNNIGILFENSNRHREAEDAYAQAVAIQKQLAADFPTVPDYREDLARSLTNQGLLLKKMDRTPAAEDAYGQALALRKQLAADFPAVQGYRQGLAITHNNLGNLLQDAGRLDKAVEAYREALTIHQALAADFPSVPDYHNAAAGTMVNLGRVLRTLGDPHAARQLLDEAVPHHEAALKTNPRHPVYRTFYRNNRWRLAETLLDLKDHAAAAETAGQFLQAAVDPPRDSFTTACLLAGCVRLAERDLLLSEVQRQDLATAYGDRTLAALKQAIDKGFKDVARMSKSPELEPLRSRKDFKELLAELEAKESRRD